MFFRWSIYLVFCFLISACAKDSQIIDNPEEEEIEDVRNTDFEPCDSYFREIGKVYNKGSETFLWAGEDSTTHFNISNWELNECNLLYGLGREAFPALMNPKYANISDIPDRFDESERCIVLYNRSFTKVYPYEQMIAHEVINEVVDGEPIMIAYCVLANLGAVYSREYCGNTLTFAVTGYTYFEKEIWGGLDAFILWDRDTESLWWPLIDKAISGKLHDTKLKKYNEGNWETLRWRDIKEKHPNALVLDKNQIQPTPDNWPQLSEDQLNCL